MSKVVFQAEKSYLQVAHDELFHVGVVNTPYKPSEDGKSRVWIGSEAEWEALQKLPDPDMINCSYTFSEGADHNQLTVEREDVIEAMRAYAKTTDNCIAELDVDGNFPADPEGTPFIADTPHTVLTPAMYKGISTAEGKTFRFNMGEERNKYITSDAEEISIIRGYIKSHFRAGITDPTYKDSFAEE